MGAFLDTIYKLSFRMDNFYRLAYTLSTHMRNVKMIYGSTFLENLIDFKLVGKMQKSDKIE